MKLKRQLGVRERAAWLIQHNPLQAIRLAELDRKLTGWVEANDAYLDGDRGGGKRWRCSESKVPFIVAVQTTKDSRPYLACSAA